MLSHKDERSRDVALLNDAAVANGSPCLWHRFLTWSSGATVLPDTMLLIPNPGNETGPQVKSRWYLRCSWLHPTVRGPADILLRCVQGSCVVRSHRFQARELHEHIGMDAWHMSSQEKLQILSDGGNSSLLKSNTHHYIPLGLGKRIDFFSMARHSREADLETNMSSNSLHFPKYTISLPSDQRIYFIRKKN